MSLLEDNFAVKGFRKDSEALLFVLERTGAGDTLAVMSLPVDTPGEALKTAADVLMYMWLMGVLPSTQLTPAGRSYYEREGLDGYK